MRTAITSVVVAAVVASVMLVSSSVAGARPAGSGATVTPYEECTETVPGFRDCVTGRLVVRQTETPSGIRTSTVLDNGRFETVETATGCTRSGSYQTSETFTVNESPQHVVLRSSGRTNVRDRCDDPRLGDNCQFHVTTMYMILPDLARVTSRVIKSDCRTPA
jgi:hypothetical protein